MIKTLRDRLRQAAGVWEGTYRVLNVDGGIIDEFGCRQETRLVGDEWYERLIYMRGPEGREVHDFRTSIAPDATDTMIFDMDNFYGEAILAGPDMLVFPYFWKTNPGSKIIEAIYWINPDKRTRIWQHVDDEVLTKLTVIREERVLGEEPEIWG